MTTKRDPLEDIIASGRMTIEPYYTYASPTVLDVNIDLLATIIRTWMRTIYGLHEPLRQQYIGTSTNVTTNMNNDMDHMITYLLWNCYNRLRRVAERYSSTTRTTRINPRAPCSDRMEFPTFLSSLIQTIGPLRINDGPVDTLIIYAPTPGTMNTYGRTAAQNPLEGNYRRLLSAMKKIGITTSPIDMMPVYGSAWTTCEIEISDTLYNVIGTIHPSHYVNEDVVRSAFLHPAPDLNPFQMIGGRVEYVDNAAVTTAIAAAQPAEAPANVTADGPSRPDSIIYNVNWYGLKPPTAATEGQQAQPRGCYIIGRGGRRTYASYLARNLTDFDINDLIHNRLIS